MRARRRQAGRVLLAVVLVGGSVGPGCSAIVSGPVTVPPSVWDDCFVGRFIDPGVASLVVTHSLSDIQVTGMSDASASGPAWDVFTVFASAADGEAGEIVWRGPLTVFGRADCTAEGCRSEAVDAVDATTGEAEVTIMQGFTDVDAERMPRCRPSRSDRLSLSFRFVSPATGMGPVTVAIDAARAAP